ncbi:MAG: hypothetical protein KAS67_08065, partial [Thermoplasmata archaeon]|nr:hypothetical protein [Thermoplasmata archaeon]
MNEMKKILAMAVMTIMVCASLVIVSPNNTVMAEDSAKPLRILSSGYPIDLLDQSQTSGVNSYTMLESMWLAQTFKPGVTGGLSRISVRLAQGSASSLLYYSIWYTNAGDPSSEMIGQWSNPIALNPTPGNWFEFSFTNPPYLSAGVQYAIMLHSNSPNSIEWMREASSDFYADGAAKYSNTDGASWNPVNIDFQFSTYMISDKGGISKVAWHEDGSYALGIHSSLDTIYMYTPQDSQWNSDYTMGGGNTFNDIKYNPDTNLFYIAGHDGGGQPMAWSYQRDPVTLTDLAAPAVAGAYFTGLEIATQGGATDYAIIAVGYDPGNNRPYAAWYNYVATGWVSVISGWTINHEVYDVAWDRNNNYYAVGDDGGTTGVIYNFIGAGDNKPDIVDTSGWPASPNLFKAIDWSPLGGGHNHALIGGLNSGNGNLWTFDGTTGEAILANTVVI